MGRCRRTSSIEAGLAEHPRDVGEVHRVGVGIGGQKRGGSNKRNRRFTVRDSDACGELTNECKPRLGNQGGVLHRAGQPHSQPVTPLIEMLTTRLGGGGSETAPS